MGRTRITVSMPDEIARAADRRAEADARSRSWVVAEAVAAYTGLRSAAPPAAASRAGAYSGAREAGGRTGPGHAGSDPAPEETGLGPFRSEQLSADFDLSPEQRVLEAELTARLAQIREGPGPRSFVMSFERYEDYLLWKDRNAIDRGDDAG